MGNELLTTGLKVHMHLTMGGQGNRHRQRLNVTERLEIIPQRIGNAHPNG